MNRLPLIRDLTASSTGWTFYLCARKEMRVDRAGKTFMALLLQDLSGQIPAKVFEEAATLKEEFDAGEFVKVHATANLHFQKLELILDRIRRVDPLGDRADGFREDDCIPSAARPIEEMWTELQTRVATAGNPWVRQLLTAIMDKHGERLRVWPAALTVHHAYRGGLLEHILKIAEVGKTLATAYGADPDLVLAGAVLHDLGKLEELGYDGITTYSHTGNLLGHITIGVIMAREEMRAIAGFPADLQTRIEHLVVSHHGEREFGSPVEPMTAEAFILSAVDDLDATLHQFSRHVLNPGGEGDFTPYHPRLKRVLLKPAGR